MSDVNGTHVMVDIETLGQRPGNHVILSIAAVKFDSEGVHMQDLFDEEISKESCEKYGMESDEGTVEWWDKQDATYTEQGRPLGDVLRDFANWLPNRNTIAIHGVCITSLRCFYTSAVVRFAARFAFRSRLPVGSDFAIVQTVKYSTVLS